MLFRSHEGPPEAEVDEPFPVVVDHGGCRGRDREREGDGDGNVAPGDARREQDGHKQEPSAEAEVRVDERDAKNEDGLYEQQERVHLARKVGAVLITTEKPMGARRWSSSCASARLR